MKLLPKMNYIMKRIISVISRVKIHQQHQIRLWFELSLKSCEANSQYNSDPQPRDINNFAISIS